MYYIAKLVEKERLFQKAYNIQGNYIYITNTKRAKEKFLKSEIKNVVFGEDLKNDKIIGGKIVPMTYYSEDFIIGFLEDMILCITSFFKLKLPLGEIAIFSSSPDKILKIVLPYGRMIKIIGEDGESDCIDGVNIRRQRKLRQPPDLIITSGKNVFSPIFKVPVISLWEKNRTKQTLSYDTISFKTDLFPFEVGTDTIMYLIEKDGNIPYTVTSFRKKSPQLFTFG